MRETPLSKYRRGTKPNPDHHHPTQSVPAHRHLTLPKGVTVSKLALVCAADLSLEDWITVGRTLGQVQDCLQFWCGDWWHWGTHKYGERKAVVAAKDIFRHEFGTLMNWGWVAGRVETSRRREVLSFSHHVEVAKLEPEDQDKWLDEAAREGWSVNKLRAEIFDRGGGFSSEDTLLAHLRRMKRAAEIPDRVSWNPLWTWEPEYLADVERLFARYPTDLELLIKVVRTAAIFWIRTLKVLRSVQAKARTYDATDDVQLSHYEKVVGHTPVKGIVPTPKVINGTEVITPGLSTRQMSVT